MAEKKVIHNPLAPRKKVDGDLRWSFKAPSYDNRTSRSIPAGNEYGVGFKTPVGLKKASGMESGPIPQKSYAFHPDRVMYGEDVEG